MTIKKKDENVNLMTIIKIKKKIPTRKAKRKKKRR